MENPDFSPILDHSKLEWILPPHLACLSILGSTDGESQTSVKMTFTTPLQAGIILESDENS